MQHLAVFSKGVIELILAEKKTLESRFSKIKFAPYKRVKTGDVVFMKESGGKVKGQFTVGSVDFLEKLNTKKITNIKKRYGGRLQVPDSFWKSKKNSKYASLIEIKNPEPLANPLALDKHDKRSWVILSDVPGVSSRAQLALRFSDNDSLIALGELLKLVRKEKGIKRKESMTELGLNLSAAVGNLSEKLANKKDSQNYPEELAQVLIALIWIAEAAGADLFAVTKEYIQTKLSRVDLEKLKELNNK